MLVRVISPHLATLRSVEGMFDMLLGGNSPSTLVGTMVRVRGVGFYDFNHGQRGRSANCIELHPIVSISLRLGLQSSTEVPIANLSR